MSMHEWACAGTQTCARRPYTTHAFDAHHAATERAVGSVLTPVTIDMLRSPHSVPVTCAETGVGRES
jgi:hypothetical protein